MNRIALVFLVLTQHKVTVEDDRRVLRSKSGYQTVSMLDGGHTGLYYDSGELAGKLRPDAKDVVLLGLGGGEMLRAARRTLPNAHFVGVDIDEATAVTAQTSFGLRRGISMDIVVADATKWIELVPAHYDVVMVDLYNDNLMVPASAGRPFFAACARALRPGGVLIMNVYPPSLYSTVASAAESADFVVWRDDRWAPNAMLIGTKPN